MSLDLNGRPCIILSMEDAQHVYLALVDEGYYARELQKNEEIAKKIARTLNMSVDELLGDKNV